MVLSRLYRLYRESGLGFSRLYRLYREPGLVLSRLYRLYREPGLVFSRLYRLYREPGLVLSRLYREPGLCCLMIYFVLSRCYRLYREPGLCCLMIYFVAYVLLCGGYTDWKIHGILVSRVPNIEPMKHQILMLSERSHAVYMYQC